MNSTHAVSHDTNIKVLVIESSGYCRDGLETLLRPHADIDVVGVAPNSTFAIRLAMMQKPDVVLIRFEEDTFATGVLRDLKRRIPDVRIVLVTERPDAAKARLWRQAGADFILPASSRPAQIIGALRSVVPEDAGASGVRLAAQRH